MPYSNIYIHLVWSTKFREPLLVRELRIKLFYHIKQNAVQKGIYVDHVGGYVDHVHCLVSISRNQNIAQVVKLIKGESSRWVNKNSLTFSKFEWQREYYAASVDRTRLKTLRNYIRNQEKHHRKINLETELGMFFP